MAADVAQRESSRIKLYASAFSNILMWPYVRISIHVNKMIWLDSVWNSAELLRTIGGIVNMTWLNRGVYWCMWFIEGGLIWLQLVLQQRLVTCLQSSNLVILKLRYINCVWSFPLKFCYVKLLIVFGLSQNTKLHNVYYFWPFSRMLVKMLFL